MLVAHAAVRAYVHNFLPVSDYSFTNRERLRTASQFQRVFAQAIKSSSETFTVLSRKNTIGYPRLGIVVAKRNAKRSTDRNLIRRIIRESFRLNKAQLPANDFVVILKRPIKNTQPNDIRQQLTNLYKAAAAR